MNIPLWVWLTAGAGFTALIVVYAALVLASICDDEQERLLAEEFRRREALARIVEQVRHRE